MSSIITRSPVLITGGAGFIGSNLTRKLLKLGYNPYLLLKESTDIWRLKDILSKVNICKSDLLDKENLTKIVKRINPSVIIHFATYSNYRNQNDFENMVNANIIGTVNLLSVTKNINYDLFINTGSSSEYGFKDIPMKEDTVLSPVSFYAATKASTTLLCKVFSKEFDKKIITLRPFSVYGPYEDESRFIPTIMRSIIKKTPIKITTGDQRRDFIYIDDITNIYARVIEQKNKLTNEAINMGTGKEYTNDEVVRTLFKVANQRVKINKGAFPVRIWDNKHWVADTSLIKNLLNWEPKYSLEEGLKYSYIWHKNYYV